MRAHAHAQLHQHMRSNLISIFSFQFNNRYRHRMQRSAYALYTKKECIPFGLYYRRYRSACVCSSVCVLWVCVGTVILGCAWSCKIPVESVRLTGYSLHVSFFVIGILHSINARNQTDGDGQKNTHTHTHFQSHLTFNTLH